MGANDEVIRLLLDMGVSKDNVQEVVDKLDKLKGSTEAAAKSTVNLGQTALQGGRFLQDFAQGGIGGVLNNVEGLVSALGGGPGLAGIMTAVGLAAYFALPKVKAWFSALVDGSNEVPKATERLDQLKEAIGANSKALEDLKGKQVLTNKELAEFNERTERAVELQKQLGEETRKRKEAELVKELKPFGEKEAAAERAGGLQAMLGGQKAMQDEAVEAAAKGWRKAFDEATDQVAKLRQKQAHGTLTPAEQQQLEAQRGKVREIQDILGPNPEGLKGMERYRKVFREMLNRSIATGDEQSMRHIIRFLPGPGFGPGGGIRGDMESLLPEAMATQEAELAADAERAQGLHAAGQFRRKQAAAAAKRREFIQKQIAEAARKKFEDSTDESRRRAAREREAKADEEKDSHGKTKAAHTQWKEAHKAAIETDIDERAAVMAAQMRMAGGAEDRFGRFRQLTPEQQSQELERQVNQELQRRFPGMAPMLRGGVASIIGAGANKQVDQTLKAAQGTITEVQALQQMVSTLMQSIRQLQQNNRQLRRGVQDTYRQGHSALTNGWPT
jgi:hypothetical protein